MTDAELEPDPAFNCEIVCKTVEMILARQRTAICWHKSAHVRRNFDADLSHQHTRSAGLERRTSAILPVPPTPRATMPLELDAMTASVLVPPDWSERTSCMLIADAHVDA